MTFILGSKGTNSILRRRQKNKENTETRYTMTSRQMLVLICVTSKVV